MYSIWEGGAFTVKVISWSELAGVCDQVGFPESAMDCFEKYYAIIMQTHADRMQAVAKEWLNIEGDWRSVIKELSLIAKETGVSLNGTRMVFFLYCAIPLREEYAKLGHPETLYLETLQDLRYKLKECNALYGEWGTFVPDWYRRFYTCERFALGRLQYEPIEFPFEDYKGIVKKGDRVYSCHIPSSGALREEDVLDSLKRAYSFYQAELKDGILPVVCHSWLLYQPLEEVFADSANIVKFRKMFDVVVNDADEKNGDFWRVFDKEYSTENLNEAVADTKLQKRLKTYLLEGKTMGFGWGILLFDGEKIINI